jgi:small-conductance mechanosensitive channel
MDIGLLRTKVMEIGEWVHADQYTGRVVSVANRAIFSDPVFNYSQHWGYLWDEVMVPVSYASDWRKAAEIMIQQAQDYTGSMRDDAEAKLRRLM